MESISLGQKIRHYRKQNHFSQMDLELEIDASPGTISRIEKGRINPTKETIIKIADALHLDPFQKATLFEIQIPIRIEKITVRKTHFSASF